MGSIPVRVTNKKSTTLCVVFFFLLNPFRGSEPSKLEMALVKR